MESLGQGYLARWGEVKTGGPRLTPQALFLVPHLGTLSFQLLITATRAPYLRPSCDDGRPSTMPQGSNPVPQPKEKRVVQAQRFIKVRAERKLTHPRQAKPTSPTRQPQCREAE